MIKKEAIKSAIAKYKAALEDSKKTFSAYEQLMNSVLNLIDIVEYADRMADESELGEAEKKDWIDELTPDFFQIQDSLDDSAEAKSVYDTALDVVTGIVEVAATM